VGKGKLGTTVLEQESLDRAAGLRKLERTVKKDNRVGAKIRQDGQSMIGQYSWDRTTGTGQPKQDNRGGTAVTGPPGQDSQDRTAGTGHHDQDKEDRKARI
jgi:hypothetical protein